MTTLANAPKPRPRRVKVLPKRPQCATCRKPLRLWQGGYGLEGEGRFCTVRCAVLWAQADERALRLAIGEEVKAPDPEP